MRAAALVLLLVSSLAAAVRPVPPPGIAVSARDRDSLESGLKTLADAMNGLAGSELLPDVRIFHEAVRAALANNGFFKQEEIGKARQLLRQGQARAEELARGRAPWTSATGLVVRGYISRIDGSVQPYGLLVPATYYPGLPVKWRLDTWFHGRGETLSEVNFLEERQRNEGEFTPPNTFVLHLYGRYCNASKFAGEIDFFEALDAVKKAYPIDENRIAIRGFSMGGASTWHISAHHAGLWAAAAPGAGFAETPEYVGIDRATVPWYQAKLWHLYNATDYAENFFNLPVVAYSGEIDKQKQAADIMARHMTTAGLNLRHVIGPKTGHAYHPGSKREISRIVDALVEKGRNPYPKHVRFTTYTLRYNRMKWVVLEALDRHWDKARIEAEVRNGREVNVRTTNVREFRFEAGPGSDLIQGKPSITIDGQKLAGQEPQSDGSWLVAFRREGAKWLEAPGEDTSVRKRPGLQGPIDDAFMDSFLFVTPSGTSDAQTAAWVRSESQRAVNEWRRMWRGEPRVKADVDVTDADIAGSSLVLWGDASTNKLIARIADKLPVKWVGDQLILGPRKFSGATHVPIAVYPNPLNSKRYIVLNSGPTQREGDYLTNARQVPRLPDYAIVDTTTPPDENAPGKIVAAGFFDERWQLQADDGQRKGP